MDDSCVAPLNPFHAVGLKSQACLCMLIISVLRRWKRDDQKSKASLYCIGVFEASLG